MTGARALASAAALAALSACGSSAAPPAGPSSRTTSAGAASTQPAAATSTPPTQAGGTANVTFSGGITGTMSQPTTLACSATPVNVYISLIGPVAGVEYDLEMEAYAVSGSGAGTYTVNGNPAANAQLGPAQQHSTMGGSSGTLTLTSKAAGSVSMTLTPSSGGTPVTVSGTWSCASVG